MPKKSDNIVLSHLESRRKSVSKAELFEEMQKPQWAYAQHLYEVMDVSLAVISRMSNIPANQIAKRSNEDGWQRGRWAEMSTLMIHSRSMAAAELYRGSIEDQIKKASELMHAKVLMVKDRYGGMDHYPIDEINTEMDPETGKMGVLFLGAIHPMENVVPDRKAQEKGLKAMAVLTRTAFSFKELAEASNKTQLNELASSKDESSLKKVAKKVTIAYRNKPQEKLNEPKKDSEPERPRPEKPANIRIKRATIPKEEIHQKEDGLGLNPEICSIFEE